MSPDVYIYTLIHVQGEDSKLQILLLARKRNVDSCRINDSKGIDATHETFKWWGITCVGRAHIMLSYAQEPVLHPHCDS